MYTFYTDGINSEKLHTVASKTSKKNVFEIDWNIWNRLQNNVLSGKKELEMEQSKYKISNTSKTLGET